MSHFHLTLHVYFILLTSKQVICVFTHDYTVCTVPLIMSAEKQNSQRRLPNIKHQFENTRKHTGVLGNETPTLN